MSQEEQFDIVDENNKLTGEIRPKSEVHEKGLWHRASHVWVIDSDYRILVGKRAKTKKSRPSLWDITAGGHIDTGEDATVSAAREMEEELGLTIHPQDLQLLFITKESNKADKNGYTENVFQHVYSLHADIKPNEKDLWRIRDYRVRENYALIITRALVRFNKK